jgi:hypothetical protein
VRCWASFPFLLSSPAEPPHDCLDPTLPSPIPSRDVAPAARQTAPASHLKRDPETANQNGIGSAVNIDHFAVGSWGQSHGSSAELFDRLRSTDPFLADETGASTAPCYPPDVESRCETRRRFTSLGRAQGAKWAFYSLWPPAGAVPAPLIRMPLPLIGRL